MSRSLDIALRSYRNTFGEHWARYRFAKSCSTGARVLDSGCGHGIGSILVAPAAREYVGVDIDEKAISWAQSNIAPQLANTKFISDLDQAVGKGQPLFDLAISFEVIEHVADPGGYLDQLSQQVVRGGRILISTPNGLLTRHRPQLYRSDFHVDGYSIDELMQRVPFRWSQVRYFREFRFDHWDSIYPILLRQLRQHEIDESANVRKVSQSRLAPVSPAKVVHSRAEVMPGLSVVYQRLLNPSCFWGIAEADLGALRSENFSTILLEFTLS